LFAPFDELMNRAARIGNALYTCHAFIGIGLLRVRVPSQEAPCGGITPALHRTHIVSMIFRECGASVILSIANVSNPVASSMIPLKLALRVIEG